MKEILYLFLISVMLLSSCKKEIDFDYNEIDTIVVIEGRVTNEGTEVFVTKSRSMTDSIHGPCLPGATVTVTALAVAPGGSPAEASVSASPVALGGSPAEASVSASPVALGGSPAETIAYDPQSQSYRSPLMGVPGTTYRLTVDFEGRRYEGTATMPAAAPILSNEFYWFEMLDERIIIYEVWATDPYPDERNQYWFRMDRKSRHPHFADRNHIDPYRWNVFEDRGMPPGLIYRDIMCMSERDAEDDKEDDWDRILYEGDTVTFQLMTIDRPSFDYFRSLRAGQSGGANPQSNLTGGCLGYFTAGSITHADTLVFRYADVKPGATFKP